MNTEQISSELMSTCFPVGWSRSLLASKEGACGLYILASVGFCGVLFLKSYLL